MTHLADFTEKELALLEAWKTLIENGEDPTDAKIAVMLGIAEGTVRSRLSRMKSKYEGVLAFTSNWRSWQQYFYQKTGGKFNPLARGRRKKLKKCLS